MMRRPKVYEASAMRMFTTSQFNRLKSLSLVDIIIWAFPLEVYGFYLNISGL